ncbi:MAG: tRNA epoxyqueuosine(34) reductase QueG [Anaerolineales bacterium]
MTPAELAQALKNHARQLGFSLAGITTPEAPPHLAAYQRWLADGFHATMNYLANERAQQRRAAPSEILPECQSILVLGIPYFNPNQAPADDDSAPAGRIAAYAWGDDYHISLPPRLQALVAFLEEKTGRAIPNRCYTDTGPLLERDLAQRAGLGWAGKNTCLIAPRHGSYFLLAEILLGLELPPDPPFESDHCGSCTRCIEACPTGALLPGRRLDARRCISFLTIENKGEIPADLRPKMGNWVFGCDICQMVCPWNLRFAPAAGDPAFAPRPGLPRPNLRADLNLTPETFAKKFKNSPLKRAKLSGYQRNLRAALENLP